MVKFAQQLRAELVPEWQEAYCSYDELKANLGRIQQQHRTMGAAHYSRTGSLRLLKSLASFKPGLSSALSRRGTRPDHLVAQSPRGASKDTIQVIKRKAEGGDDVFVTELREPLSRSPVEKTFFARLDAHLTKVNKFYKKKEGEYIAGAGVLEKQMLALINLQEDITHLKETSADMPLISKEELKSNEYPLQTFPMNPSPRGQRNIDEEDGGETDNVIQEYIDQVAGMNLKQRRANFAETDLELASPDTLSGVGLGAGQVSPQNHVQFSPDTIDGSQYSGAPTPRSALKKASQIPELPEEPEIESATVPVDHDIENQKVPTLKTEKEFNQAKNLLRLAFVEFYRGLGLLSSFRSLNITAFAKILKKYDKQTGWHFSPIYMKEVESSYFVTSLKVQKLTIKVEDIFIKHFADGVRKKAISQLRPTRKQGSVYGVFDCSVHFFLLPGGEQKKPESRWKQYHSVLGNGVSGVQHTHVADPPYILLRLECVRLGKDSSQLPFHLRILCRHRNAVPRGPPSGHRIDHVFAGAINIHIAVSLLIVKALPFPPPAGLPSMPAAPVAAPTEPLVADVIPLILILVILPDFFLGDQLTSQVLVFRNLQFMACYYLTGYFLNGADTKCDLNPVFRGFGYVVALHPFWWRFLQCLRRYYDEKDTHQLENAGKYFFAIVALGLRQGFSNHPTITSLWVMSIIASIVATIFASYWDLCVDCGLLNRNSRNKWLRDKIILKRKSLYFVAIGVNCFLRLVWMLSILQVDQRLGWNGNAFNVSTASLEIFRRGIWNFFRIGNEHLNNVGKYRAVKAVPLPFNDD